MAEKPKIYPYVVGEEERRAQQRLKERKGLDPARMDVAATLFTNLRSTLEGAGISPAGLTVRLSLVEPQQSPNK